MTLLRKELAEIVRQFDPHYKQWKYNQTKSTASQIFICEPIILTSLSPLQKQQICFSTHSNLALERGIMPCMQAMTIITKVHGPLFQNQSQNIGYTECV